MIKTRWGQDAKGIQFDGAMPGIKFALGELQELKNVGDMVDLMEAKLASK